MADQQFRFDTITEAVRNGSRLTRRFVREAMEKDNPDTRITDPMVQVVIESVARTKRKAEREGRKHMCVKRIAKSVTGTTVWLADADHRESVFDNDGGRWITFCETHGTVCNHETRKLAEDHLRHVNWCECCMETCEGNCTCKTCKLHIAKKEV